MVRHCSNTQPYAQASLQKFTSQSKGFESMHAWRHTPITCMHDLKSWRRCSDSLALPGRLAESACNAMLCASLSTGDQHFQNYTGTAVHSMLYNAAVGKPMHLNSVTEHLMGICVVLPAF